MKTLKYIILGVILLSLVVSSFSFSPSKKSFAQTEALVFCETYTQQEVISKLDPKDTFFSLVHLHEAYPESSKIGTCNEADLKLLWNYIQGEAFKSKFPNDLIIAAGAEANDQMISLYAIRKSVAKNGFPSQKDIDEVSISLDSNDNYSLLISFSQSGVEKWASITKKNKGRDIAILYDGKVIAAPRVIEEIKGGKCSISGNYTEGEIKQLKAALEK